jgi:hypothetical protein
MVESLEKCIDHMRVDNGANSNRQISADRENLEQLLDEIRFISMDRRPTATANTNTSIKQQQEGLDHALPPQRPSTIASRPRTALRTPDSSRRNHNFKVTLVEERFESDEDQSNQDLMIKDDDGDGIEEEDDEFMLAAVGNSEVIATKDIDCDQFDRENTGGAAKQRPETAPAPTVQRPQTNTSADRNYSGDQAVNSNINIKRVQRAASALPGGSHHGNPIINSAAVDLSNPFKAWIPTRLSVPIKRPDKRYSTIIRPTMYMDGIYRDTVEFRKKTEEERHRLTHSARRYLG